MLKNAATLLAAAIVAFAATPSENFYSAIRANDLDRLRTMLKDGADVNAKDDHGVTPLMAAAAAKPASSNSATPNRMSATPPSSCSPTA